MRTSEKREKIVVGYDGAASSTLALDWALAEGSASDRPVEAVFARGTGFMPTPGLPVLDPWPEDLSDELRAWAEVRAREIAPDVPFTAKAVIGSAGGCLVDVSVKAALVVVGRRRKSVGGELVLGSTSSQVAAHAHCPVVVVDEGTTPAPTGPVVVGVDGSAANEAAVGYAFERAAARGTHIVAVLAWWWDVPDRMGQAWLGEETISRFAQSQEHRLAAALAAWTAKYPDVGVLSVVQQSRPVDAIVGAAHGAECIVVGSRGHGGFTGLLLGSTSQGLLHHARPCPLVVVHPED